MHKINYFTAVITFIVSLSISVFFNCTTEGIDDKDKNNKSSAKAITSFVFTSPAAAGTINESNHTISVTLPYGTNITNLAPEITFTGTGVSPASGAEQNFTNPVTYSVKAEDNSTQEYTVTVTVAAESSKAITAFNLTSPAVTGTINESNHTITLAVPNGTNIMSLTPTITITGASINPLSGAAQNFTNPVTYTVKAADNSTQEYTVIVTVNPADAANLTAVEGFSKVILSWTPPADVNFSAVEITAIPAITTITVPKGANTAEITGLTNGASYTFTVKSVYTSGVKSAGIQVSATPASTFSVTYIGNNNTAGSAPVDSFTYTPDSVVTVLANSGNLIKIPAAGTAEAYKFGGWNTQADGNGTTYEAGTGTFTITINVRLYAKWVSFNLRDMGPAGGLIFYDKGSFYSGWRYLEAAPGDQGSSAWGNNSLEVGGTSFDIGTGGNNTAIISSKTTGAARNCYNLTVTNGAETYSDWFLPSKWEVNAMYNNLKTFNVGNFSDYYYWSSSEQYAPYAHFQDFRNGAWTYINKTYTWNVRAARAF